MMKLRKKTHQIPIGKVKNLLSSLTDNNMDKRKKWLLFGIIVYILSPVDILPDVLPVVGYADDVVLPILLLVAEHLISDKKEAPKEAKKIS